MKKRSKKAGYDILGDNGVSLWRRIFAYLIDAIIVGFIIILPMNAFISNVPEGDFETVFEYVSQERELTFDYILNGFFIALFSVLYWALLEYYLGQSIGKMVLGIKVDNYLKIKGKKKIGKVGLSFRQCFMRNVTKVSTMILFLDLLYGIFKGDKRRFFEVISNTHVVYSNNGLKGM